MKVGDLVKFAKEHSTQDGLDYCADWLGYILYASDTSVEIQWFPHPASGYTLGIDEYHEDWWNTFDYPPFEVVSAV